MTRSIFAQSLLALAAIPFAGAISGCSRLQAAPSAPPPIPTVVVAHPERSMVQDTMDYTGRIEPSQRVDVRSRVSGYLQRIAFRDGQQVKAGDPLFVIDPRPFVAMRDRALATLTQARAREKLAAAQYERSEKLRRTGAASQEELERARGEIESAHAAVLLSQAELRSAELELSFTTVRAPIAGTVSDRRVDVGNYVTGASAQSGVLTTLVAHDPVRAVVDLQENDFQRLRQLDQLPGKVELTFGPGVPVKAAAVDFVDNEISARSGTVRLRASLPNADRDVIPGSFARMRIPLGGPQERLLVPGSAVMSDQDKKIVFVVDVNSKVVPRRLVLGRLVGDKQVVVSGLAPDERVIVSGTAKVRPGDHVRVAHTAAAGS